MKFFDIHVAYDVTEDVSGYSVFVKANVTNEEEALEYAVEHNLFTEEGDEECVDYIEEISENEYTEATK